MLNNSWPSLIWHLYDYFLRPGGGFFGTQKGCQPLHVMYAYDDRSVVVINDHPRAHEGLRVEARVINLEGKTIDLQTHRLGVGPVSATAVCKLEPPQGQPLYFVDLRLFDADGAELVRNFYWLPSKLDVLDDANANWVYTPVKEFADLTPLRGLRETPVTVRADRATAEVGTELVDVVIANRTGGLAFFVQLRLADEDGDDVLPVVWSDNYVSVLPGERATVRATVPFGKATGRTLFVEARGLNVPELVVRLPATHDKPSRSISQGEGESHV
jgi:exo-1,4-beta-D-glucosaminidase